jgi:hypothetical protein
LKRGGPIERRTPLRPGEPPKSKVGLQRRTPLRKRSAKKSEADKEFERNRLIRKEMAGGFCEIREPGFCKGVGNQAHHVLRRGQHVDHSVANLRWACHSCHHDVVHARPEYARKRGWLASGHEHFKERPPWRQKGELVEAPKN